MGDLFGPDVEPEMVRDAFVGLAVIALRRGTRPGFGLLRADEDRLVYEIARMLRKAYRWGQSGVEPADQVDQD